jgi:hypothetical protein
MFRPPDADEVRVGQVRAGKVGKGRGLSAQLSGGAFRQEDHPQMGQGADATGSAGVREGRAGQVRFGEIRTAEDRQEDRAIQLRVGEVPVSEVRASEVRAGQVRRRLLAAPELARH